MQLKTALLSTAVVAALAGLCLHTASTGTPAAHAGSATLPTAGQAASAVPAMAATTAAAHAGHRLSGLLADTGARPGSELAFASASPAQADATSAAQRARGLLQGAAGEQVHRVAADAFVARDVMIDRDGTEHVRMERTYQGLPVVGGDFVVHSRDGELESISQGDNMRTFARPALTPKIGAERARIEAGAAFDGVASEISAPQLVVFARATEPTLAYQVDVRGERNNDPAPGNLSYFIDAADGKLLQEDDHVHAAAANGTGKTLTLGNVGIVTNSATGGFEMTDPSRGNGQTLDAGNRNSASGTLFKDADNVWGNNATSDRATAAADAHYGVAATWDYYKNVHGRNGIFNDGRGVKSYVHYGPTNLVNAYWDGTAMLYGDGDGVTYRPLVALDVAGHEMTHGVTGATARLGYYNIKDSGGINEGISDIFGTLVEFSVANANDPGDYLLGEEVYISNPGDKKALRVMFKQDADGASKVCYPAGGFATGTQARGPNDPHFTSGVINRVFYLASEGAVVPSGFNYTKAQLVCNNDTGIVGIGRDKVGAIMYRALTRYFVSSTTYPQARTWTLQAATDLYGANSAEYNALARVWTAVNVN